MEAREEILIKSGLNGTQLKMLAIICMVIDHAAWTFLPSEVYPISSGILHFIGRLTFPILCFFIGEGYRKSSNVPKYMLRLFILAVLSAVPFCMLFFNLCGYFLDTIFTLFFGLCALYLAGKTKNKFLKGVIVTFFMIISVVGDAGVSGVLLIYMFGTIDNKKKALIYGLTAINLVDLLLMFLISGSINIDIIVSIIGVFASYPLLMKYNEQRGKSIKYFFYIFYPLHIIVLLGAKMLIR
ncbi:TraX family protein [Clostridium sp. CTA-5]